MSVAAVQVFKNKIVLGADSQIATSDTCKKEFSEAKIWRGKDFMFASTGECSEISLFTIYCNTKSPIGISSYDDKAALYFFIGFIEFKKELGAFSDKLDNDYLFVFNKKAFLVGSDLYVKRVETYQAIGAGMAFAEAILWAGHSIKHAIKAACQLSPFCDEPVVVYEYNIDG
jgi:hypothetical protein